VKRLPRRMFGSVREEVTEKLRQFILINGMIFALHHILLMWLNEVEASGRGM
jgi:hypothetical protein